MGKVENRNERRECNESGRRDRERKGIRGRRKERKRKQKEITEEREREREKAKNAFSPPPNVYPTPPISASKNEEEAWRR